jgi:hypothetical protein
MGPSLSQLRLLSPEDRIIYKKWLRRSVMLYGAALTLLVVAVAANHIFASASSQIADDSVSTVAMSAGR